MNLLIVDRRLPFAELASKVSAEGWQRAADPTAPPPIIEGEPEFVEWRREDSQLRYRFEPATGLRELRFTGPRADAAARSLAAHVPCHNLQRARELLDEASAQSKLLALQMIEAMDGGELLGDVLTLTRDANPTVAQRAHQVGVKLMADTGLHALRVLGHWKQAHPELSAIFLLAGSAHDKLQILRWLAYDRRESNAHIDAVLRTGMQDADWDVRVTAMVVAARLRARGVLDDVCAMRLPQATADGVNRDERRMLRSFQLAAIELLQGKALPPAADSPPNTRAVMHDHLLRCLAGEHVAHREKAFLWLTSLLVPLPDEIPPPQNLPAAIRAGAGGYLLEPYGLALRWVPPVDHWLGDELPRMQIANPIRQVRCAGFFIAREVSTTPERCGYDAAIEYCRALGAATALDVRLPTADEWEMAARGPDGRRFPWGNNARSPQRFGESPWGLSGTVGRIAQWTSSVAGAAPIVCGGEQQWVCAMREPAQRDALHAVRIVIQPGNCSSASSRTAGLPGANSAPSPPPA